MENLKELMLSAIENTNDNFIKNDQDYINLEKEKVLLMEQLKNSITKENYKKIEMLVKCFEEQNLITAMGFSFVRVLDLDKLI